MSVGVSAAPGDRMADDDVALARVPHFKTNLARTPRLTPV